MEYLQKLEDRYLIAVVLAVFLISFAITGDVMIGDMVKVLVGSFGTIIVTRSEKMLVLGSQEQTKVIVDEFTRK